MEAMPSGWFGWGALLVEVAALACVPMVLARRKESASSVAWILTLLFLPGLGLLLFLLFGRERVRRPVHRRADAGDVVRRRLARLDVGPAARREAMRSAARDAEHGLMGLAERVGHMAPAPGCAVRILETAEAAWDAQMGAIEAARHHVHVAMYAVDGDEEGARLLEGLCRAARRGVEVRLLLDGFGSRSLPRAWLRRLRRAGGQASWFLPLEPLRRAWTMNLRNHRKIVVVDGREGFSGGVNVGRRFALWRDVQMALRGPVVHQLQATFAEDWFFARGEDLAMPLYFPEIEADGRAVVQIVPSGPDGRNGEAIHRLFFAAIASAHRRVWIGTPYFVPDPALRMALQTAAQRGVDVRVLLPSRSNHAVTFHAGRSYYEELLEAGVRIFEYLPGMFHAKVMVVDEILATVGSANFDIRSFRLNFELVAVLWDRRSVAALAVRLQQDLSEARAVDISLWRRRPLWMRWAEGYGRLVAPLL